MNHDPDFVWTTIISATGILVLLCLSNCCLLLTSLECWEDWCFGWKETKCWPGFCTVLICAQAFTGVYYIYINTRAFLAYPGELGETIESLKLIRTLLNDCSDNLTQIHTPGPIEYLEG